MALLEQESMGIDGKTQLGVSGMGQTNKQTGVGALTLPLDLRNEVFGPAPAPLWNRPWINVHVTLREQMALPIGKQ